MHHHIAGDELILTPVDEGILLRLILQDTHLSHSVLLEVIVIAIQMVGCDVEQHGNMCLKAIHVFKLEAAQLDNIPIVCTLCHL